MLLKGSLIKNLKNFNVNDSRLRERLLREPDLDLQKAIELGQGAEETKQHVKELSGGIDSPSPFHHVTRHAKPIKPQASKS